MFNALWSVLVELIFSYQTIRHLGWDMGTYNCKALVNAGWVLHLVLLIAIFCISDSSVFKRLVEPLAFLAGNDCLSISVTLTGTP